MLCQNGRHNRYRAAGMDIGVKFASNVRHVPATFTGQHPAAMQTGELVPFRTGRITRLGFCLLRLFGPAAFVPADALLYTLGCEACRQCAGS